MSARMTVDEIERTLVAQGVPAVSARRAALAEANLTSAATYRPVPANAAHATVTETVTIRRRGAALEMTIALAPRTKKNGTTLGIKQSPAYRRYRDAIIRAIAPLKAAYQLPLPNGEYNIAAVYYVDVRGKRADKVGLDQGLYDALENAGVIGNDWQFRTADGTRIVFGDQRARVELSITPLPQ